MSYDLSYRKIYIGKQNRHKCRSTIINAIDDFMIINEFIETLNEAESDWSYVLINGASNWVHIADVGWMEREDSFAEAISKHYPIVNITIIEEIVLKLKLFEKGHLKNQVANCDFYSFSSVEFNKSFYPKKWKTVVSIWKIKSFGRLFELEEFSKKYKRYKVTLRFGDLLPQVSEIFGWNKGLSYGGYYIDSEGEVWRGLEWNSNETFMKNCNPIRKHYKFIGNAKDRKYASVWKTLGWDIRPPFIKV